MNVNGDRKHGFDAESGDKSSQFTLTGEGIPKNAKLVVDIDERRLRSTDSRHPNTGISISSQYEGMGARTGQPELHIDLFVRPPLQPDEALELATKLARVTLNQIAASEAADG